MSSLSSIFFFNFTQSKERNHFQEIKKNPRDSSLSLSLHFSLSPLELLVEELSLAEAEPPLVRLTVGRIAFLGDTNARLLTDLTNVLPPVVAFRAVLREREREVER